MQTATNGQGPESRADYAGHDLRQPFYDKYRVFADIFQQLHLYRLFCRNAMPPPPFGRSIFLSAICFFFFANISLCITFASRKGFGYGFPLPAEQPAVYNRKDPAANRTGLLPTEGMVLEWLKRHAWKACNRQNRFGGSNPPHSAKFFS